MAPGASLNFSTSKMKPMLVKIVAGVGCLISLIATITFVSVISITSFVELVGVCTVAVCGFLAAVFFGLVALLE